MEKVKAMPNLYDRLAKIQVELKSPKSIYNEFGKFNYRSCEGILEAVKPMLKGDLILLSDKMIMLGDRFYLEATAKFTDGKESIEVTALAREEAGRPKMSDPQLTGTASSYARKYALGGLLLIDDAKNDPDGMDNDKDKAKEDVKPPYKPAVPQTKPDMSALKERTLEAIAKADTKEALDKINDKFVANIDLYPEAMAEIIEEAFYDRFDRFDEELKERTLGGKLLKLK